MVRSQSAVVSTKAFLSQQLSFAKVMGPSVRQGVGTAAGTTRPDLAVPTHLYSSAYPNASVNHRTYETLLPLSQRLGLPINTTDPEGQEAQLAASILASDAGGSLVCWGHSHIPDIAANIPVVTGVDVPTVWLGDRFDLIRRFTPGRRDCLTDRNTRVPSPVAAGVE